MATIYKKHLKLKGKTKEARQKEQDRRHFFSLGGLNFYSVNENGKFKGFITATTYEEAVKKAEVL